MAIGPGSHVVQTDNPKPLLWFTTDDDVIQIYNPLDEDFVGLVGNEKQANEPFRVRQTQGAEGATADENSVKMNYGLQLKNPDHHGANRITTQVKLPAGSTTSWLGGIAKVVVNQLVTEIMHREGNSLKIGDPHARLQVEQNIVKGQGNVQEYLPNAQTQREQVSNALAEHNQNSIASTLAQAANLQTQPAVKKPLGRTKKVA